MFCRSRDENLLCCNSYNLNLVYSRVSSNECAIINGMRRNPTTNADKKYLIYRLQIPREAHSIMPLVYQSYVYCSLIPGKILGWEAVMQLWRYAWACTAKKCLLFMLAESLWVGEGSEVSEAFVSLRYCVLSRVIVRRAIWGFLDVCVSRHESWMASQRPWTNNSSL